MVGREARPLRSVHVLRASHVVDVGWYVGARNNDRKCRAVVDLEAPWRILIIFLLPSVAFRLSKCRGDILGTGGRQKQGVAARRELHAISASSSEFQCADARQ